jgi:hypothetical protein
MDRVMSRREVLAALKRAPRVFVWVKATADDGTHYRAVKSDVAYRLTHDFPGIDNDDEQVILAYTDGETGTLHIN